MQARIVALFDLDEPLHFCFSGWKKAFPMRVIVTGGTGYIGSHTVVELCKAGHETVILDNFMNSLPIVLSRLSSICGEKLPFHEVDLTDAERTTEVFREIRPEAVIHFAGLKAVGESVEKPALYYRNNIQSALSVAQAMEAVGCELLVFSSSATVYGDEPSPFRENQQHLYLSNPYGWTKVMIEQILADIAKASALRVAFLRYFNPVGAHPSGLIGEDPRGIPNNLMPFITQVATGKREKLTIFGGDYPTPDGTCLRDYLHVMDLAEGHARALAKMTDHEFQTRAWNLGRGETVSVLELVKTFEAASGQSVPYVIGEGRQGDLAAFWADASLAREELGWTADRTVEEMCVDTWRWQAANPDGYR